MTTLNLKTATPGQINEAVALHVAGYRWRYSGTHAMLFPHPLPKSMDYAEDFSLTAPKQVKTRDGGACCPDYLSDANEVIALLERQWQWSLNRQSQGPHNVLLYFVAIETSATNWTVHRGIAPTFCRAACLALLRASGKVEVID